jgi:glutathione S-transferase
MAEYRLYCFAESGNSYKPALMLALSGCDWESRWVDYFNGETRGEVYRSTINELGEAPVLEHGGKRLTQSGVILTYLAERTGRFGGRNADERLEVLRWLLFDTTSSPATSPPCASWSGCRRRARRR